MSDTHILGDLRYQAGDWSVLTRAEACVPRERDGCPKTAGLYIAGRRYASVPALPGWT